MMNCFVSSESKVTALEDYKIKVLFPGFCGKMECNFYFGWGSFALLQGNGHNVLIDTGWPGAREELVRRVFPEHGLTPKDIDTVLLTHLHWDHAGNAELFRNATFVMSEEEWTSQISSDPADLNSSVGLFYALRYYNKHLVKSDGEEVLPGITALLVPGHTSGSTAYVLHQQGERIVFSGDAAKNRGELSGEGIMLTANMAESARSIEKILKNADKILPGHDNWVHVQNGKVIDVEENVMHFTWGQGVTVNGGLNRMAISLDPVDSSR